MLGNIFYHQGTRNLIVAFGDLFNNISVVRFKTDGTEYDRQVVSLAYGPKQKWYTSIKQDPNNRKEQRIVLPQMGFEITNLFYDNQRKLITLTKFHESAIVNDAHKMGYVGTPMNYSIELGVYSDSAEIGFQVVEQILPYFTPSFTISMKPLVEIPDYVLDVPIVLKSITKTDDYEGTFDKIRVNTWTLSFEAKYVLFGPITEAKVIKKAIVDMHAVPGSGPVTDNEVKTTPRHVRITTQPNPLDATAESDYGFTILINEYDDNKHYDPVTGTDVPVPGLNLDIYPPAPQEIIAVAPSVTVTAS